MQRNRSAIIIVACVLGLGILLLASRIKPTAPHKTQVGGLDQLIEVGASIRQVNILRDTLLDYVEKEAPKTDAVEVVTGSVKRTPRLGSSITKDSATFKLKFDTKIYDAKLEYISLRSIRLIIFDEGKQIYDSGPVEDTGSEKHD